MLLMHRYYACHRHHKSFIVAEQQKSLEATKSNVFSSEWIAHWLQIFQSWKHVLHERHPTIVVCSRDVYSGPVDRLEKSQEITPAWSDAGKTLQVGSTLRRK